MFYNSDGINKNKFISDEHMKNVPFCKDLMLYSLIKIICIQCNILLLEISKDLIKSFKNPILKYVEQKILSIF